MSVSTKSPFAFVCRIAIRVDAGAVAEAKAKADNTNENTIPSRKIKYKSTNTAKEAANASNTVMIASCLPLPLNEENLKNSPAENAINASAMSDTNAEPSITFCGTAFKQNGPIKMPATMYAVTFGNFKSLVRRVIKNPAIRIIPIDKITADTGEEACSFS